jgi:hypothetical protein
MVLPPLQHKNQKEVDKRGGGVMSTFEAISLMISFGVLLITLITYLDRNHNRSTKK